MAKNIYGAQTMTQGRVGGVVYKIVNGEQVIMPFVRPSNPRTAAQLLVRARMAKLGSLAMRARYALRIGMKAYGKKTKKGMVGAFVSLNQAALTGTSAANLAITPNRLQFSDGNNMTVEFGSSITVQDNTAVIPIAYNFSEDYPDTVNDKVYAVAYCPDLNMCVVSNGVLRTSERISLRIPSLWNGSQVSFYGFTVSPDGVASPTTFIRTQEIDD